LFRLTLFWEKIIVIIAERCEGIIGILWERPRGQGLVLVSEWQVLILIARVARLAEVG